MIEFLAKYEINFNDIEYYNLAMIHPSYKNEDFGVKNDNQRLEFLGDSVINLVVAEYFYNNNSNGEGMLTKLRSKFVCEAALSYYSDKIGLTEHIKLGKGETNPTKAIVADAFEAFIAALYFDLGFEEVKRFFNKNIVPIIELEDFDSLDYKSRLQELVQSDKRSIAYQTVSMTGPSHKPVFEVVVLMDNIILGKGVGSSKKIAEQNAAKSALDKMAK